MLSKVKGPKKLAIMGKAKKTNKQLFVQWLTDTTIHGWRYTVNRELHLCENILWAIITISFIACGSFLIKVTSNETLLHTRPGQKGRFFRLLLTIGLNLR